MHGIWMIFDPRRALTALAVMITVSSITLHFVMLSTTTFDFLDFKGESTTAAQMAPLP
jgi:light-harvesting complex 1 alpha chain